MHIISLYQIIGGREFKMSSNSQFVFVDILFFCIFQRCASGSVRMEADRQGAGSAVSSSYVKILGCAQ